MTPWLVKINNDLAFFSPVHEVKSVDAFDFVTYTYAPCAKDASVSVKDQKVMGGVDWFTWPLAFKHDVVDSELIGEFLQFA